VLANLSNKFINENTTEQKDSFAYMDGIQEFDESDEDFSQFRSNQFDRNPSERRESVASVVTKPFGAFSNGNGNGINGKVSFVRPQVQCEEEFHYDMTHEGSEHFETFEENNESKAPAFDDSIDIPDVPRESESELPTEYVIEEGDTEIMDLPEDVSNPPVSSQLQDTPLESPAPSEVHQEPLKSPHREPSPDIDLKKFDKLAENRKKEFKGGNFTKNKKIVDMLLENKRKQIEKIKHESKSKAATRSTRTSPTATRFSSRKGSAMVYRPFSKGAMNNPIVQKSNYSSTNVSNAPTQKNFNIAYSTLSKKLIKNSMVKDKYPSLLLTNREIKNMKRNEKLQKSKQNKTVYDRLYQTNTKKVSDYSVKLEKQRVEKELQDESFRPRINSSKFDSRRRSMKDFIEDMNHFSHKKESKIMEELRRKQRNESQLTNSFFKHSCSRSPDFTKLNNLYDKGVKKQRMRSISPEKDSTVEMTAMPKINKKSKLLKRDMEVSEILYNDAQKRQQKMDSKRSVSQKKVAPKKSTSNDRANTSYLVSKISRDIEKICESLDINPKMQHLDFSPLVESMCEMGYVSHQITDTEKGMINLMWKILRGDELNGVSIRNLLFFLIGINQLNVDEIFYKSEEKSAEMSTIMSVPHSLLEDNSSYTKVDGPDMSEIHCTSDIKKLSGIGMFSTNDKFFFKNTDDQTKAYQLFSQFIQRKASLAK